MENQVTSIEQSKRLLELGVPAEKASMVWSRIFPNRNEWMLEFSYTSFNGHKLNL